MNGTVFGWDIGGAHLKVARVGGGVLQEAAQWPCALWFGPPQLQQAFAAVRQRWPSLASGCHAVTMTGEMADCFPDRASGVTALTQHVQAVLGEAHYFGAHGWRDAAGARTHWREVASANWLATAVWVARQCGDALLVDIGSTTTDIVPVREGQVAARGRDDAARLASGELVYQGVVRTPLAALAQRIGWRGREYNVMNELFATAADVYRLTGELEAGFDQQPTADQGPKDVAATCRRLARMIGHDAADATVADWLALAHAFRAAQLHWIEDSARRVLAAASLDAAAPVVIAGCGGFLGRALAQRLRRPCLAVETLMPTASAAAARWARVCAPSAAVALLYAQDGERMHTRGQAPCGW
ncbi:MAG: H4MPT-linked C1 transfer pathway protein [Burkholderiaceae bacterium]|nr:H4MPT-linked C1 transfer pathway protein [Burkholderiaceae bacterium]